MTRDEYADQWAFENVPTWLAEPDVMQEVRRSTIREWLRGAFLAGCAHGAAEENERCAEVVDEFRNRKLHAARSAWAHNRAGVATCRESDADTCAEIQQAIRDRQEGLGAKPDDEGNSDNKREHDPGA